MDKNTATPKVTLQCHRAQLPMVTALFKTSFIQECVERFSVNPACAGIWQSAPMCFQPCFACLLFVIFTFTVVFLLIWLHYFLVLGMNNNAIIVGEKSQNTINNRQIEPGLAFFSLLIIHYTRMYITITEENAHFVASDCPSAPICTVVCS